MAQETRKDPRAKVLTMTVRYKSATIDEFIEHHSYDVSRGGIFIKTPSPFLPGTLLKFEIRIADDKPMLQGVGRVVWKRDAMAAAAPDKPAGMGVKFIKVDEASRSLIDRLVSSQGGGGSAFDAELPADGGSSQPQVPVQAPAAGATLPRPAAPSGNSPAAARAKSYKGTMIGLGTDAVAAATASPAPAGAKQPAVAPRAAAPASPTAGVPAATIMGAAATDSAAQKGRPPRPEPMFPKTESFAEMPAPEERTVMKQAAELLQEALREAGGSLDDVGAAPAQGRGRVSTGAGAPRTISSGSTVEAAVAPSSGRAAGKTSSAAVQPSETSKQPPAESTRGKSPRPAQDGRSGRPATAVAVVPAVEKKRASAAGMTWWLLVVIGASAAAYSAWPRQASAPEPAPAPAVPAAAVAPPAVVPAGSAVPAPPAAGAASLAPASASPGASASAAPPEMAPPENPAPAAAESAPAAAAPEAPASATGAAPAPAVPPNVPAPVAPAVQAVHAAQPAPPPAPPRPPAPPPAPPKPVVETAPAAPPPVKVAPAAVPPKPKPAPPPPPKPATPKPSDDNPY